jgi:pyruvate,water dikinase
MIVPLSEAAGNDETLLGGKAHALGRLIDAGYRVPDGFCITVTAYERFLEEADLVASIDMELGRKAFSSMRWEEMWDAALRIRTAFLAAAMPNDVACAVQEAYRRLAPQTMAVRSSAPGEDSAQRSFAGLHESLVGVTGEAALLEGIRVVWASLWSDASLLYRQELDIDPHRSRMAVVVQSFVDARPSGVGFGIDPREPHADREVVEAVPGPCEELVSGMVDPDRWIMKRSSGQIVEWRPGQRDESKPAPILQGDDLEVLHKTLRDVETLLACAADIEWTGRGPDFTLLQARPVTTAADGEDEERAWYLSLRLGNARLKALCDRVTEDLIPRLEAAASAFAAEDVEHYSDLRLADAMQARSASLQEWKRVYRDEFIPFAHGVRRLALYYNDAVRPTDPYEFLGLLRGQAMIASERNASLESLASTVRSRDQLRAALEKLVMSDGARSGEDWQRQSQALAGTPGVAEFVNELDTCIHRYLNVTFSEERLDDRPDLVIKLVLQLARADRRPQEKEDTSGTSLEKRLLDAVGPDRREEALDVLRIGRLSWKLRDDDNVLIGRLENQLVRALQEASRRLQKSGRLGAGVHVEPAAAEHLATALRDGGGGPVVFPRPQPVPEESARPVSGERPRQMIGQPAAPGCVTGLVRIVRDANDIGEFQSGEVVVCDAIQPTMTHVVPLAGAIVERRGGMLIHGTIIARELGVPCVNGVAGVTEALQNGDLVTVDGYLGIVTVGPPEFDLERRDTR